MKKFVLHTFLFLLPVLVAMFFIMQHPVKRSFAYHYEPDDCENRASWLYQRIFEDSTPIDIAFAGSSHTMCGVDDAITEQIIDSLTRSQYHVANLGYCRFGEEIPFVIVKDLLANKTPKAIVVEVREGLSFGSHPVYPFLAEKQDVIHPASWMQASSGAAIYDHWLEHLSQFRSDLFAEPDTMHYPDHSEFGYRHAAIIADSAMMNEVKKKKSGEQVDTAHSFGSAYPLAWIDQLRATATQKNVKLFYLYMPGYGSSAHFQQPMTDYAGGTLLEPPAEILNDFRNWRDADHLNDRGAVLLSNWLAGELKSAVAQ